MESAVEGREAAAPEAGARLGAHRRARILLSALVFTVLLAWTFLILGVPSLSFSIHAPDAGIAIQTAGTVVSVLTAAMAYLRFSLSGRSTYLLVAVAFAVLGANQLVFGIVLRSKTFDIETNAYLWLLGRLVAAGFLLLGAFRLRDERVTGGTPFAAFVRILSIGIAVLACAQAFVLLERSRLPSLADASVRLDQVTGVIPGITGVNVTLGLIGACAFVSAAVLYTRLDVGPFSAWLPPALVIAAFSHIHYMLMPTVYSGRISTGDLLRVAFATVLLVGLMEDVWATYVAERERRREVDLAYRAEVQRVAELEQGDRARAELWSLLTHELLNPVAGIRSNVLALAKRWDAIDDSTRREIVDRLELESRQLVELAERVPTTGGLERSPFTVNVQEREVRRIVRDAATLMPGSRPLDVEVDESVANATVRVDPVRIAQVFSNLLSNAVKFSPNGAPVRLSAWRDDGEIRFRVSDSGPGLADADADRIFEPFVRGSDVDQQVPGSGLGLYVAKGIVEAHGGRIWAESTAGGGAVFTFAVPAAGGAR